MNKNKQFCGIDISKDVFDVVDHEDNHLQYPNDQSGFKEFRKILTKQAHCVMEVTGSYYQGLVTWFHSKPGNKWLVFLYKKVLKITLDNFDFRCARIGKHSKESIPMLR